MEFSSKHTDGHVYVCVWMSGKIALKKRTLMCDSLSALSLDNWTNKEETWDNGLVKSVVVSVNSVSKSDVCWTGHHKTVWGTMGQ